MFLLGEVIIRHRLFVPDYFLLCVALGNDQLDAQILNTSITILYMYMFRAISCSSSGGQIVLTLRLLMSYIYGAPILDVSRSHTTTQHSR